MTLFQTRKILLFVGKMMGLKLIFNIVKDQLFFPGTFGSIIVGAYKLERIMEQNQGIFLKSLGKCKIRDKKNKTWNQ